MRKLTGSRWTAHTTRKESLADALFEAAALIARQEKIHPITQVMFNDMGVPRIHHSIDEDGMHEVIVLFEGEY